jgi:hypothetical protein
MFGWPNDVRGVATLLGVLRSVARIKKSVIFACLSESEGPARRDRIDLWWRGRQHNGDMMLLLAHLLSLNAEWRRAVVTVRTIVPAAEAQAEMKARLVHLITEARIEARTDVIVAPSGSSVVELMHKASRDADVVFLGLRVPEPEEDLAYAESLMETARGFRSAIFVRNSGPFRGKLL